MDSHEITIFSHGFLAWALALQEINVERQRRREDAEREAIAEAVKKKERWTTVIQLS